MRGNCRHTPNPWFLVDNQLCATLAGQNFEHFQLNRVGHARCLLWFGGQFWRQPQSTKVENNLIGFDSYQDVKLRKRLPRGKFRHQSERRSFPHEVVPWRNPPPPRI